uniref:Adrenomedullin 5 (putative) n=1 Tax=Propithecus coquereli TaxID=379532 RepID=A0A2K6GZT4_PROCO
MTARILVLMMLLAVSAPGDPDSEGRRPWQQVAQHRGRLCSLGTCQTHRLPEIIYWLRALGEGRPQAPGPPQLRAPAEARGESPAPSPGPPPAAGGPAERPDRWVTSGTLPICVLGLLPQFSPLTPPSESVFLTP